MKHLKRLSCFFLILIACCLLFSISVYWIFSATLLNTAFFNDVTKDVKVLDSFEAASKLMSENGIIIESQPLRDNALSIIDGIIRYIAREDMTFSSISIDNLNIANFSPLFLNAVSLQLHDITDVLQIHPYMLSYFLSGSGEIYSYLQSARNGYALYSAILPVLGLFTLFVLLLSNNPAKNIYKTLASTSVLLIITFILLRLLQYNLLIAPIEMVIPDLATLIEPFILRAATNLSLYFLLSGIALFIVSLVFRLKSVCNMLDKTAKRLSVFLIIIAVVFFVTYHHDLYSSIFNRVGNTPQVRQVSTLAQNESSVHLLVLELKEEGSDSPVKDVQLIVNKIDYPYNPLYVSAQSDMSGKARFILPNGSYLVYVNESTLPLNLQPFEPVVLELYNPGNSRYTMILPGTRVTNVHPEIQSKKSSYFPY